MQLTESGYIKYVGLVNSVIEYDLNEKKWIIQSMSSLVSTASSKALGSSLLLGKHPWVIENDNKCQLGVVQREVKLSSCEEGEFTCSDGDCIDIEKRCDKIQNCQDWSDEIGCTTVNIPKGYLKEFAPIKLEKDLSIRKVEVIVDQAWFQRPG